MVSTPETSNEWMRLMIKQKLRANFVEELSRSKEGVQAKTDASFRILLLLKRNSTQFHDIRRFSVATLIPPIELSYVHCYRVLADQLFVVHVRLPDGQ
jgi:hypothetical protein